MEDYAFPGGNPDITPADLLALIGDEMLQVAAPRAVCTDIRFLAFPPTPPRNVEPVRFGNARGTRLMREGRRVTRPRSR